MKIQYVSFDDRGKEVDKGEFTHEQELQVPECGTTYLIFGNEIIAFTGSDCSLRRERELME
jgi:hypothetical protein